MECVQLKGRLTHSRGVSRCIILLSVKHYGLYTNLKKPVVTHYPLKIEPNVYFGSAGGDNANLDRESEKHVVREHYELPVDYEIVCGSTCDN